MVNHGSNQQPKSDRTSVTISKKVQWELRVQCARLGVTQRSIIEMLVKEFGCLDVDRVLLVPLIDGG